MNRKVRRFYERILIALAGLCGILFALGALGFWMGYQAQETAETMKSYEWIHNGRCLERISNMPDPGTSFKFAVFGDIQIGTAQLPRLSRVLEEEAPVAFVVQTGDAVSHADSGHYNLFLNELALTRLSVPFFVVPGNHDVRNDSELLFEKYFGPRQLWFEYGKALFILADNALGPLDNKQYDWMEEVLKRRKTGIQHIFLFMHRQPINWTGDGVTPVEHFYQRLFELLKKYRVDYVFSGNWHGYRREKRNGTVFVVNGRGGDFDHDARLVPCYCVIVEVQRDAIQDRVIEFPPRLSIVLKSQFKDLFVAHIGEFVMRNQWFSGGLLLFFGSCCTFLIVWSRRVSVSARQKRDKATAMG